ncbi:MAG: hypothetical protein IJG40_07510 [Oscillospiraceae bacterium]|nr:hypothetical protein [Oscillospiraceae bacterium]
MDSKEYPILCPIYQEYLFDKHILVGDEINLKEASEAFSTVFALARLFGIRITSGQRLAHKELIELASRKLGENVPLPFYRGFPKSVRELTRFQLLFDQLLEYYVSYGMNDFSGEGHSVFERDFERAAFREDARILDFRIVSLEKAKKFLADSADALLRSTRPLRKDQFEMVKAFVQEEDTPEISRCACKDTAIKLLLATKDLSWLRFLHLSDTIAVVDELNYEWNKSTNLRKLNLKNQQRKFITQILDRFFENSNPCTKACYEKKALWCGLLHHIHYQPKNEAAAQFVQRMRGKENHSAYSAFEGAMSEGEIEEAVSVLLKEKGSGILLRNLNYLLSRCRTKAEVEGVLSRIDSENTIVLLQLYFEYALSSPAERRIFRFAKHSMLYKHTETDEELARRKTVLPRTIRITAQEMIEKKLRNLLKNRLRRVCYDPQLNGLAIPLQEGTSLSGFGALPRGSRLPLPDGKIIRAFTYWEKVNDIDLSVIGICRDGSRREFSWRTMASSQSTAIAFSGDVTRGYNGGSEFFDIDIVQFCEKYPDVRYLVFCDNVFSGSPFKDCICTAGYMMRDRFDSGEIFEPKTVHTSYRIDCDSTIAMLFAFDLDTNEFVWLNLAVKGRTRIAGTQEIQSMLRYLECVKVLPFRSLIEMMAQEMTEDLEEADLVISDRQIDVLPEIPVIHSYDLDKMVALINSRG